MLVQYSRRLLYVHFFHLNQGSIKTTSLPQKGRGTPHPPQTLPMGALDMLLLSQVGANPVIENSSISTLIVLTLVKDPLIVCLPHLCHVKSLFRKHSLNDSPWSSTHMFSLH